jgi:hypothetical protein
MGSIFSSMIPKKCDFHEKTGFRNCPSGRRRLKWKNENMGTPFLNLNPGFLTPHLAGV